MSSLIAALNTMRTIYGEIEEPRNIKQNTVEAGDWAAIKATSAPNSHVPRIHPLLPKNPHHRTHLPAKNST